MRVAYLSTFYPFRGGIAQFNASLYRSLEKKHEVKAFTFSRQYPDVLFPGETQYVTKNDIVDSIPSIEILDSINPLSYIRTAKAINDYAPDVIIMKFWMSFFGPSLGTVCKRLNSRTKVVSILDNVIPHEKRIIDKPFTKYFLKQNDGFIVMSEAVRTDLLKWTSNPRVQLLEHPNYSHFGAKVSNSEAREKLSIDSEKKTILFFGFIRDYKGLDLLIEAFERLDESYQLVIAGESYGSFDKYQSLIDKSRLKDNIIVHNYYISDERVPLYFSGADVCVLPYKSATQSGITSIAFQFDLPIIATKVGGLTESVIDGKNGLVADANPDSIADSIIRYFSEHRDEGKFIRAIQQNNNDRSWDQFGDEIIRFAESMKL